ncbi:MAG: hypothetical protein O7H40_04640, partial [Gammaproteobacteria bacterium]|nr:hypothetical protein [Gammaproteobacteria bacterium]
AELALGNADEALELSREGVVKATPANLSLLSTLDSLVKITLALECLDECAEALDRMDTTARGCGASNYFPLIVWRRADLAAARGDAKQQARLLREAHAGFVERGANPHAETISSILSANIAREVN